jgi:ferritin-like protein
MAAASASLHESPEHLRGETIDRHRAIVSLMEELEAIDWYDQRIDAAGDEELRRILAHNRDEEKEHAVMLLEWIRRRDPALDRNLRKYIYREEPIVEIEERDQEPEVSPQTSGSLAIGSLRGGSQ